MKKALTLFILLTSMSFASPRLISNQLEMIVDSINLSSVNQSLLFDAIDHIQPNFLINWNIGDRMEYKLSGGGGLLTGTMVKAVTKFEDVGGVKDLGLWLKQEVSMMGRKEVIEALLNRNTGEILKLLHNGQEQQIPDDKPEIISQEYTSVTVPAGTFKALYIVAKTKDVSKLEVWMNPTDTVMEGTLKQIVPTSFLTLTFELTQFSAGHGE